MNKPFPCYCRDCKHSKLEGSSRYFLRCHHPVINSKNPNVLGSSDGVYTGIDCSDVRSKRWFASCGIKGKLWEAQ